MKTQYSRHYLMLTIVAFLSLPSYSATVTWDGGGDGSTWSSDNNWFPNGVPDDADDITIDCSCTVTHNADLQIDGSLTIASGTTLDLGSNNLTIGQNGVNNATLTNNGTITTTGDISVKGDGLVGGGPFITNSGTITVDKFNVGNNNGGGKLTNTATGTIISTGDWHVDGTIDNAGVITVTAGASVLFHGAVVTGGGAFNADLFKLEDNPGTGASGGPSDIQNQSFFDADGACSGANSATPLYQVSGGVGGGPNGDDTYTYQQLLDEFGLTDGDQFAVDQNFVSSCGEAPLPIELLYFSAEQSDNSKVNIEWATASETDNDYFVVERSINGVDWEQLSQVSGAGNSSTVLNYSIVDLHPYKGISYYQLKQVDYDGAYSHSQIISISIKFTTSINIFPIPIKNQFTITGESMEDSEITMTNALGQEVHISITKTLNKAFIKTSVLNKGVYFVTINRNGVIEIKKLLVV